MKIKRMTLEQAQDYVKNTKYIVKDADENMKLQLKLFEIGCGWSSVGKKINHEIEPFLFVNKNLKIKFCSLYNCFDNSDKRFVKADDIFNIRLE